DSLVEECLFAKTFREFVKAERCFGKNLCVRFESDFRSALARLAGLFQWGDWYTTRIFLLVSFSVAPDLQVQHLRKEIDARNANAMQTTGNLVSVRIKLTAGVKLGHYHFRRRSLFFFNFIYRDTTPVIDHGDRIVQMDRNVNGIAITC